MGSLWKNYIYIISIYLYIFEVNVNTIIIFNLYSHDKMQRVVNNKGSHFLA